ncbi:MAG: 5-methyltetrahydropteroyltriglutamate--homocysteine S-methyltransferase [Planctomycetota bacterium]|nr:MAG: 5-methyltetrahydropteroyltriglutamate--homocysteine S-methyltransferase [Planctomycetota bacterium]
MVTTAILGFPRIGANRELKRLQERYWSGRINESAFIQGSSELRLQHLKQLKDLGLDIIPSNDAPEYDAMLDTTLMLGAIPERFNWSGGPISRAIACRMARGQAPGDAGSDGVAALEMTKWFDTNYHYLVPELSPRLPLQWADDSVVRRYREARDTGIATRPVLIGPLTWLRLGKADDATWDALELLPRILPIYREVLTALRAAGAESVQIDEPILATDLDADTAAAFTKAYTQLCGEGFPAITLATYFAPLANNLGLACSLPVAELHVDAVRGSDEWEAVAQALPADKRLSVGIIDGRNVWAADLEQTLSRLHAIATIIGPERLTVASSCSLMHVPVDVRGETDLDNELRSWLSFAVQKVEEIVTLGRALNGESVALTLAHNAAVISARCDSGRVHRTSVQQRMATASATEESRGAAYTQRAQAQAQALPLPPLPTTTIGSFPQTPAIRATRARYKTGEISAADYRAAMQDEIRQVIQRQEAIGLDVLVHGEAERNDMVEYFGEHLSGFVTTRNGWVLSYGSRCVKPPLIYGDLERQRPMTVDWARFAQSCTDKPVKGMLTGPVTMLQWSFVRNDQPRRDTCRQLAYAIRDEVADLQDAGIAIIQIDEPAFREGLPIRGSQRPEYLDWAVRCFRVAAGSARPQTQIHTHMCYSEFNDIIGAIADLDADVISIETSRSHMELLDAFRDFAYPNGIGPGVYDIHSPRVPPKEEMQELLSKACTLIPAQRLWVNPDCGLKTRKWDEVEPALRNLVACAQECRLTVHESM